MKSSLPIRLLLSGLVALSFFNADAQIKFNYLGQYNALGVPDNLEDTSDAIGQLFLNDINNALPERKPVPDFHPEYIAQKNETDIVLKSQADIWITFVNEAAVYTNALGYYTYNAASPPKTIVDIKARTIIFPNVSLENSGGGLKSGNKVYLGSFEANTAIGWFVVADAFKNGKMTSGKYIVYSEPALNPETDVKLKAHTVLLKDAGRGKLVLGFEDVLRDQGSDQDFNDMTFYITASPYSAIKTDDVVAIDGGSGTTTTTTTPKDTIKTTKPDPVIPVDPTKTTTNNTNNNTTNNNNNSVNINNNVNNNGQNGTGSTSNTTNTTNNVNTGTSNNTNTNSNNTNTTTNTNNNSNNTTTTNNTTVINNTTIIQRSGSGGGNRGGNNNNTNNNTNVNNNTNNNTNGGGNRGGNGGSSNNNPTTGGNNNTSTNVSSNVTVCNRDGFAISNFNTLKATIKAQSVESNKPMVIKQAVKNKRVTVSQVKEIIKLIVVEQYKLDMAKYLFDFTCDKSNYYELNALLNPSRARELDEYLKNKDMSDDNVTSVSTNVTNSNSNNTNTQNYNNTNTTNNTNYTSSGNILCDNGRMPYEEFDDIKSSIDSKSFSDTKITVLKEAMPSRCISSIQVKEIIGLFSFESDKLTVAKYLYRFTTDKQNYYKVNDAFSFSSTIDELKEYIKTSK